MSIPQTLGKIKIWAGSREGKTIALVILFILTTSLSFGLGRLSVAEERGGVSILMPDGKVLGTAVKTLGNGQNTPLKAHEFINQTASVADAGESATTTAVPPEGALFTASKRGKKYYPIWCKAAESLLPANKIYFKTEDEAIAKGYTKSTSCK